MDSPSLSPSDQDLTLFPPDFPQAVWDLQTDLPSGADAEGPITAGPAIRSAICIPGNSSLHSTQQYSGSGRSPSLQNCNLRSTTRGRSRPSKSSRQSSTSNHPEASRSFPETRSISAFNSEVAPPFPRSGEVSRRFSAHEELQLDRHPSPTCSERERYPLSATLFRFFLTSQHSRSHSPNRVNPVPGTNEASASINNASSLLSASPSQLQPQLATTPHAPSSAAPPTQRDTHPGLPVLRIPIPPLQLGFFLLSPPLFLG